VWIISDGGKAPFLQVLGVKNRREIWFGCGASRWQKHQKAPKSASFCIDFVDVSDFCGAFWDFWGTFGGTTVLFGAWGRQLVIGKW